MYNYQQFLQNGRQSHQLKKEEEAMEQYLESKAKRQTQMITNHEKRIQHSILRLLDEPLKISIYKDPNYRPRQEDKTKRIVNNEMLYNYELQTSRINNAIQKNSSLDLVPFKIHPHQFRGENYEFNPINSSKKRSINIEKQNSNIKNQNKKSNILKQNQDDESIVMQQGKTVDVYPKFIRHPKTYFHTLQTIVNQADSLKIFMKQNNKQTKKPFIGKDAALEYSDPFEFIKQINPPNAILAKGNLNKQSVKVQKCRQVLQKCGLTHSKTPSHEEQKFPRIR